MFHQIKNAARKNFLCWKRSNNFILKVLMSTKTIALNYFINIFNVLLNWNLQPIFNLFWFCTEMLTHPQATVHCTVHWGPVVWSRTRDFICLLRVSFVLDICQPFPFLNLERFLISMISRSYLRICLSSRATSWTGCSGLICHLCGTTLRTVTHFCF